MVEGIEHLIGGLLFIVIGTALIPIVFTSLSGVTWNISIGGTYYNLAWMGYVLAIVFGVGLIYAGIKILLGKK